MKKKGTNHLGKVGEIERKRKEVDSGVPKYRMRNMVQRKLIHINEKEIKKEEKKRRYERKKNDTNE